VHGALHCLVDLIVAESGVALQSHGEAPKEQLFIALWILIVIEVLRFVLELFHSLRLR